jgi:hypothetical protein
MPPKLRELLLLGMKNNTDVAKRFHAKFDEQVSYSGPVRNVKQ